MNVFRALIILMCSMVFMNWTPPTAQAQTRLPVSTWVHAKIDSTVSAVYGAGTRLVSVKKYGHFPERGDAGRAIPMEEIHRLRRDLVDVTSTQDGVLFGATSPTRFDPIHTGNSATMNDLNNQSLRIRRAQFMNNASGRQCLVIEDGIENDTTVVYLAIVERPSNVPSKVPGRIVESPRSPQPSAGSITTFVSAKAWFRPSVGAGLQTMEPYGFATPLISGSGGIRLGSTDVGIYAMEGQDFQPDLRGLSHYGVQLGDELGWALRLGYQSDWTELRGDGHTDRRREGGEVGVAYGTPVFSLSGYVNLGWYADRRDRAGRIEPGLALALTFGPVFRSGN